MPVSIHIPTPLRPFTNKLDVVQASGATVGELLQDLTTQYAGLQAASLCRRRPPAQLRQRLRGRRGHPLPAEGADAGRRWADGEHHPVGGGRGGGGGAGATGARARRDQALQPSPHPVGSGHGGAAEAEGRQGAVHRRRRAGVARGHVSGRGRRGHDWHRRFRLGRPEQPAAPDPARHRRRGPVEARLGEGHAAQPESARARDHARGCAQLGQRARSVPRLRRGRRRHRQLSRRATS